MRILLTADSTHGREVVGHCLRVLGHEPVEPQTVGAGALLATTDWTADLLVVVLLSSRSPRERLASIGVEAGVAIGRGLPVLVVARPGAAISFLAGVPRVDFAEDPDLLGVQLDLVLDAVTTRAPRESATSRTQTTQKPTARSASSQGGSEFETAVGRALSAAGAEMLVELGGSDGRSDFALSFPGEPTALGLVLIEVKSVPDGLSAAERKNKIRDAARRLSTRTISAGASLGVVVYDGPETKVPTTPLTISMSFQRLVSALERGDLKQVLWRARNEAIHAL